MSQELGFDLGGQTGFANARFAGDEDYLRFSASHPLNEQAEGAEFAGPTEHNRTGDGGRKSRLHPLLSFPSFQPVFDLSSMYLWVVRSGPCRWYHTFRGTWSGQKKTTSSDIHRRAPTAMFCSGQWSRPLEERQGVRLSFLQTGWEHKMGHASRDGVRSVVSFAEPALLSGPAPAR